MYWLSPLYILFIRPKVAMARDFSQYDNPLKTTTVWILLLLLVTEASDRNILVEHFMIDRCNLKHVFILLIPWFFFFIIMTLFS